MAACGCVQDGGAGLCTRVDTGQVITLPCGMNPCEWELGSEGVLVGACVCVYESDVKS